MHKLKPRPAQEEESKMGFPYLNNAEWGALGDEPFQPNKQRLHINAGASRRVWHKPNFGLFRQNKWIPTAFAPLTFEFTLQDGTQWCDTNSREVTNAGDTHNVPNSTLYELRNMYLHYDVCQLDSEMQNEFAQMLRGGGALNIVYESSLMQTQSVLNADFTIQVLRNLARVKCCFVTFSTALGDHTNKPLTNEFYLPPSSLIDDADTGLEYFMTLGGKKLTTFPIGPEAVTEMFYRLKCAAGNHDSYLTPIGITMQEYLNNDINTSQRNFIIGQDLEMVPHAGFTGEDFGGGRAFLLDVKHLGDGSDLPARCHILLVHETAMSITESGVMVSM